VIFPVGRRATAQTRSAGRALYESAVRQARAPALYAVMGAPDTVEGRFELLTLHVILIIERLRGEGETSASSSQALFDAYVRDLDGALREMGVGDFTVGKRMRALGGAFYGRAAAYRAAFEALPDRTPLEQLVTRTVMGETVDGEPTALADYAIRCRAALASSDDMLIAAPSWPNP